MRQVMASQFAQAALERATKRFPNFKIVFEEGIMWQLQRSSLTEAVEIPGSDPPVFVLESIAWRAEGIPRLSIGFTRVQHGIEIVSLSLREDTK
jgi:hypothetical protein